MKPKPLTKRTMTLDQLQVRAVKVLRKVKRQFNRMPYEEGMSDVEFVANVIDSFLSDIEQDRDILKLKPVR